MEVCASSSFAEEAWTWHGFPSYRAVSNLQYSFKLTEKAVFSQTHEHMIVNEIYTDLQSSYRQHHSTETALLNGMNEILLKMNSQQVTMIVLSALFSCSFMCALKVSLLSRTTPRILSISFVSTLESYL